MAKLSQITGGTFRLRFILIEHVIYVSCKLQSFILSFTIFYHYNDVISIKLGIPADIFKIQRYNTLQTFLSAKIVR